MGQNQIPSEYKHADAAREAVTWLAEHDAEHNLPAPTSAPA